MPGWVEKEAVRLMGKKDKFPLAWAGNYLALDRVPANDAITIEFPLIETVEKYRIPGGAEQRSEIFSLQPVPIEGDQIPKSRMDWDGIWYTCHFKADTLIRIEPKRL
jgi:hypothetical protein